MELFLFKTQATEDRAKEFDELKVENNALKARVQLLEEGQISVKMIIVRCVGCKK